MKKTLTLETREAIITSYNEGESVKDISDFMKIPWSTVKNVIIIYVETGCCAPFKRGGDIKSILSDEDKNIICSWIYENPRVTHKSVKMRFLENCGKWSRKAQ